jgi:methyltransferase (TIGR00027 family)
MRAGRASRTAAHNALFRALEAARPPGDRVVDDPLAAAFLPPSYAAVAWAARRSRPLRAGAVGVIDRRWPGVRTSVVARTRLIDDTVSSVLPEVGPVVVLGAGFDTRPYRLPDLTERPVFEVDHPDTQRRKRARLEERAVPHDHVRFVAVDLTHDDLATALATAGLDRSAPALVLWEGVTNYLDAEAVDATLAWCAGAAPGSHVVFTYVDRRALDDPGAYDGADRVFATLRRAGESMTFGLAPAELAPHLDARGLALVDDRGAADYRRLVYGPAAAARMTGHEFYRVAHARVPGGAPTTGTRSSGPCRASPGC